MFIFLFWYLITELFTASVVNCIKKMDVPTCQEPMIERVGIIQNRDPCSSPCLSSDLSLVNIMSTIRGMLDQKRRKNKQKFGVQHLEIYGWERETDRQADRLSNGQK